MTTLNEMVSQYLAQNGIKMNFFANYIGCSKAQCCLWLKGERKLTSQQIEKTHEFLRGKFLKSADEIIKGE